MIPTKGCIKNYHWGKVGEDNYIARFQAVAPKSPSKELNGPELDSREPLAELWFGSHPSGPATLAVGDHMVKLNEFLAKEPEMVGVVEQYLKYNKQLPFLFKILSVAQPLSLQAHPDKKLAQILHKQDPKNYPDANHKPELAIALTEFHVLCDFRPHKEIANFMRLLAPLKQVAGNKSCELYQQLVQDRRSSSPAHSQNQKLDSDLRLALADCFKNLMTCSRETILRETKSLIDSAPNTIGKDLLSLVVELEQLYPGDPGVFAPFFLNYLKLAPGQGVFLKANKLHAYLKGECIECMACSDNVVRAGLTTKYRDVQTLVGMLDYDPVKSAQDLIMASRETTLTTAKDCSTISFITPTEEFKVDKITISHKSEFTLPSKLSGSFLIVLNGKAMTRDFFDLRQEHKIGFGFAGFIPPKIEPKLFNIQGTLVMYRAYC